jgi:hypothetical protein
MADARWLCTGRLAPWIGAALVLLILFARKPDSFVNPQFWAEDGSLFFTQQIEHGARAHLIPYAGTFNEAPRIVASLGALLPYRHAPAFYNAAAVLALLALVLKLYSPRLGLSVGRLGPLPFALAVVLVPHPRGEVFACLANVQWILALLLLLLVLQKSAATGFEAAGDALLVLVAGLTGPFIVFALPLLAWKLWRSFRFQPRGARLDLPAFGVAIGTATVQLWALLHSPLGAPRPLPAAPDVWVRLVGHRLFGTLFLGPQVTYRLSPVFVAVTGFLVLGAILWALRRSPEAFERAALSLVFAGAVVAAAFAKHAGAPGLLLPWANGSRYFFIPAVVLAWCLLLVLATSRGAPRLLASAALAAVLTSSVLTGFQSPPLEDRRWEAHVERIGGAEREVSIPINPRGWKVHIPQRRNRSTPRLTPRAGPA